MAQPVAVYTDAAEEHPIVSLIGEPTISSCRAN